MAQQHLEHHAFVGIPDDDTEITYSGIKQDEDGEYITDDVPLEKDEFQRDLHRTAQILEQIGVIRILPNWNGKSRNRERYYITNPSLTCQLILLAFHAPKVSRDILGRVYESCVLTAMENRRSTEDRVFFYEENKGGRRLELDGILVRNHREVNLVECKMEDAPSLMRNATIRSKALRESIAERYPDADIRSFVVYTGTEQTRTFETPVQFVPFSKADDLTAGTLKEPEIRTARSFYDAVNLEHPEWEAEINESRNKSFVNLSIGGILVTVDFKKQEISAHYKDGTRLPDWEFSGRREIASLLEFWKNDPPFPLPKELEGKTLT